MTELTDDQRIIVAKIVELIRRSRIDLSNEKSAQADIATILESEQFQFDREVRLSKSDIIDFMGTGIGIEVKLHGANKQSVFRQLTRYAFHEQIACLILVSNLSMGLPPKIEGKDAFFVSIGEGWL